MKSDSAQRAAKAYNTRQRRKYPLLAATDTLDELVEERTAEQVQARHEAAQEASQAWMEKKRQTDQAKLDRYHEVAVSVLGRERTETVIEGVRSRSVGNEIEYITSALLQVIAQARGTSPLDTWYWIRGEQNPYKLYEEAQAAKRPREQQAHLWDD